MISRYQDAFCRASAGPLLSALAAQTERLRLGVLVISNRWVADEFICATAGRTWLYCNVPIWRTALPVRHRKRG
jgi:hypothetical protein